MRKIARSVHESARDKARAIAKTPAYRQSRKVPRVKQDETLIQIVAPQLSILNLLTETEQWLDLHKLFGPLSGFDAKIDDPRKRFITTLFCYGCNLGPPQTVRSVEKLI